MKINSSKNYSLCRLLRNSYMTKCLELGGFLARLLQRHNIPIHAAAKVVVIDDRCLPLFAFSVLPRPEGNVGKKLRLNSVHLQR